MKYREWYVTAASRKRGTVNGYNESLTRFAAEIVRGECADYRAWSHIVENIQSISPEVASAVATRVAVEHEDNLHLRRARVMRDVLQNATHVNDDAIAFVFSTLPVQEAITVASGVPHDVLQAAWPTLSTRSRRSKLIRQWQASEAESYLDEDQWWVLHTHPGAATSIRTRARAAHAFSIAPDALFEHLREQPRTVSVQFYLAAVANARSEEEVRAAQACQVTWDGDVAAWKEEARALLKLSDEATNNVVERAQNTGAWTHPLMDNVPWQSEPQQWTHRVHQALAEGEGVYEALNSPLENCDEDDKLNVIASSPLAGVCLMRHVRDDEAVWNKTSVSNAVRRSRLSSTRSALDAVAERRGRGLGIMHKYGTGAAALRDGDILAAVLCYVSVEQIHDDARVLNEVAPHILTDGANDVQAWNVAVERAENIPPEWVHSLMYKVDASIALPTAAKPKVSEMFEAHLHRELNNAGVHIDVLDSLNLSSGTVAEQVRAAAAALS